MKYKTYKGDLSKLRSCIKISGALSDLVKISRKLISKDVPFSCNLNAEILVQFEDWLKGGMSFNHLGSGIRVVEYIEPLGLDIKLSKKECEASYNITVVLNHYRGLCDVYVEYFQNTIRITHGYEFSEDIEKDIMFVLLRRGLIKKEEYETLDTLDEMRYYEA